MGLHQTFLNLLVGSVAQISEPLKVATRETVKTLYEKAKSTSNPYDDIVVDLLANLLGVELDGGQKTEDPGRE